MRITIILITPKKAAEWLQHAAPNRPVDMTHVRRLAGAISEDRWIVNGETIKFDTEGQLQDGRHRLNAVIMSGKSIRSAVAFGVSPANGTFESIDTGKKRTIGDMFARQGESHYRRLAAAVAWLWRADRGALNNYESPRHDEAMDVLKDHPKLIDSVQRVGVCSKVLMAGMAAFLHYKFAKISRKQADEFFELLGTGEGLSREGATSGIYRLREKLLSDRQTRSRQHAYVYAAMCVKAWNAFRAGRTVKSVVWRVGEEFPEME